MYKIIWVDGYVLSLSGGVPSCPLCLRKMEKVVFVRMRFVGGERSNVSFRLIGSENSTVFELLFQKKP